MTNAEEVSERAAADSGPAPAARYRLEPQSGGLSRGADLPDDSRDFASALLQRHVSWFILLRSGVVPALALLGLVAWLGWLHPFGLDVSPVWPLALAFGLGLCNAGYARHARCPALSEAALRVNLTIQIAVDLLAVTWLTHEVGSVGTPAPFLYLLHIILACVFFPAASSVWVLVASTLLYFSCIALESAGVLPARWLFGDAAPLRALWPSAAFGAWTVSIWAGAWYLSSHLGSAIRRRDHELAEAYRQVRQSFEMNREHMFQTAHQFKSPLAGIQTAVTLHRFEHPETPAGTEKVFGTIDRRCEVLRQLVGEILLLARLREGQQREVAHRPVAVDELIAEVSESLRPIALPRGITVETRLSRLVMPGDLEVLRNLLENLILNAINYSRDRGVVEVGCEVVPGGGGRVTVRDHGIGIRADMLPRIFDAYYRTPEAKQHCRYSTGVGLAIVREAAGLHGIAIEIESRVNAGTAFILHIPSAGFDAAPETSAVAPQRAG